jgi:hypothetical protein
MARCELPAMTEDIDLTRHRLLIEACLRHRVRFFWRSPGTLLIDGRGIRAVIDDLQSTGQVVIGLEGFELESTIIHPRIDLIFDALVVPIWDRQRSSTNGRVRSGLT